VWKLGGHAGKPVGAKAAESIEVLAELAAAARSSNTATPHNGESPPAAISAPWAPDAEKGLRKIPFFVRGKARRNTEQYAHVHSVPVTIVETLYDAKAHFGR